MEWVPTARVPVFKVATPLERVPVPMLVPPDSKVTVPVGVPPLEVTVAVNVTTSPAVAGLAEETSAVAVVAGLTTRL